ncbi:Transposase family Tnp2 protein [Rhizoctonia solani]|uniref:Transposase family Tnp2 protein n=1 Tax=Rhizoctonia solani TaxID=456999 RepID=A0A8H8T0E3_9AGAM|nr:Transposase family Tnp2 protein [Rhizoctonia solani]QRW24324.1 Transposase family Tnp2 protein [Rhizoctonia solani]
MDHSELMRIYPVCPKPTCGKQYTTEQLYQLPKPRCTWNVGERCPGVLYTERLLADGTIKRSPSKLFPYIPLPAALGRLLSRPGMSELCQHWRNNDNPKDEPTKNPPRPQDPVEWFDDMPANQRFSDISKGWGWRAHATGLTQQFIDGDLTLNADGYQANGGNYTAGGSYTSNGVYIVINNLPYFEWNLFENTILAMVLPGPTEPKDYAFNQMMEPLIDNLISLSNGVDLPVHDAETGEIQDRRVYANLLVLVVDWIARIKCTGHVGATAEENHCPYCKLRACLLSTGRGYDHEGYDLCDPHKHLQDKHQWLRAEWHKRNDIRNETGTTFTELDRLSGFYAFDNAPTDVMHLVDLGLTEAIKTCRRLPTHAQGLKGRVKADQRRLSRLIMIGSYFEAWRVGNSIPDGDIPRGSERSKHYKAQKANAKAFRRRRNHVNDLDGGKLDKVPPWHEFMPLRNPRNCVYNTSTAQFERANQMLINVNKNGHGGGEIEATMAKGFMRCVECYRYINELQLIERPTDDNTATTKLLLQGMRDARNTKFSMVGWTQFWPGTPNFLNKVCTMFAFTGMARRHQKALEFSFIPADPLLLTPTSVGTAFVPVIIQGIYKSTVAVLGEEHKFLAVMVQRFVAPAEPPAFPWNHWDHILGIGAWEYQELQPVEAVPATAFTGLFALSNIEMSYGRFWLTFAMITTRPDNLMDGDNMRVDD